MGKLIVLEGIDGSGKSTQFARLTERLEREGAEFRRVKFPRYGDDSSALVRMYLGGAFGDKPDDVNPYAASTFFAVDRYASFKREWGDYYNGGGVVLMDRYTTSNAIHQGAKLPVAERESYFRWLYDFEFRLMGLPAPTVTLYMDISLQTVLARIGARAGEADIHETDAAYLRECYLCGRAAAAHYGWLMLDAERDVETIHAELYAAVTREI
ncbi:MAG: deoxynucleoside kinase [Oscillospiraceae bacterium]|jgi:dTMP kinase|nr:deoxynucleoside kinase [Oscillospiraceae bacterium]